MGNNSTPESNSKNFIQVSEIIKEEFPKSYGIPHFQRGGVWNNDDVSMLLESMYYETPCGSFVFWKPSNLSNLNLFGKPIIGDKFDETSSKDSFKFFVIDGQQRIRNIRSIFIPQESNSADDDEDAKKVWCINLTKIFPELKVEESKREFRLFVKRIDPFNEGKLSEDFQNLKKLKYNYLPIYIFKKESTLELYKEIMKELINDKDQNTLPDEKFNKIYNEIKSTIFNRIQAILRKSFHFDEIPDVSKTDDIDIKDNVNFSFAIDSYNRINKGGKRVEAEERAFATLVKFFPDKINDYLKKCFEITHSKRKDRDDSNITDNITRDDYLARMRERNLGFKFFLRVLIQNIQYHLNLSSGSENFSFDIINDKRLRLIQDAENKKNMFEQSENQNNFSDVPGFTELTENSMVQIKYLFNRINDDLYCDYFVTLPQTFALQPVIQLLIQYPDILTNENEKAITDSISGIILGLLLSDLSSTELMKRIKSIKQGKLELKKAIEEIKKLLTESIDKNLNTHLKDSDSPQNKYVLLLYWLERRNKAREFNLKCIKDESEWNDVISKGEFKDKTYLEAYYYKLTKQTLVDVNFGKVNEKIKKEILNVKLDPQRQHIVPYDKLKLIYEDLREADNRISSHEVNNIGNITWMSAVSNGIEYGVSNNYLKLSEEDDENLEHRFFIKSNINIEDSQKFKSAYKLYEKIRKKLNAIEKNKDYANQVLKHNIDKTKKDFLKFTESRIKIIAVGFKEWYGDLFEGLPNIERFEPLSKSINGRIRTFDFDNEIEDSLIGYISKFKVDNRHSNDSIIYLIKNNYSIILSKGKIVLREPKEIDYSLFDNNSNVLDMIQKLNEFVEKVPSDSKENKR